MCELLSKHGFHIKCEHSVQWYKRHSYKITEQYTFNIYMHNQLLSKSQNEIKGKVVCVLRQTMTDDIGMEV
jgi:hypothetical protein